MQKQKNIRSGNKVSSLRILAVIVAAVTVSVFISAKKFQSLSSAPFSIGKTSLSTDCISKDSFTLARNQSFGFFDEITNEQWLRHQQIFRDFPRHAYPDDPLKMIDEAHEWYQYNYDPNFSCQFERRIGGINSNGDGGKWICNPNRIITLAAERRLNDVDHPGCVIYSVGCNGDFSFEIGIQNYLGIGVCEFHIFDVTNYTDALPNELKRAHFHDWGLRKDDRNFTETENGFQLRTLIDTITLLGHQKLDVIDIFKIDCEYCEWSIYDDWIAEGIPMLHQILVEVHQSPGQLAIDFFDFFEDAGYLIFHKEPNIYGCPDCIEYGFVKVEKSFMDISNATSSILF